MRKFLLFALAAATAMPAIAAATPAAAQSRHEIRRDRHDLHHQRRDLRQARRHGDHRAVRRERRDVRHAHRELRQDRRDHRRARNHDRRDYRQARRWNRHDWRDWRRDHRHIYRRGHWRAPFRYHTFRTGIRIAPIYYSSRYYISDPYYYRLPAPGYYQRWVRHYDDVLLIDIRTGLVLDVIRNFYW